MGATAQGRTQGIDCAHLCTNAIRAHIENMFLFYLESERLQHIFLLPASYIYIYICILIVVKSDSELNFDDV